MAQYITETQASKLLDLPVTTLRNLRNHPGMKWQGPPFYHYGPRQIRYIRAECIEWQTRRIAGDNPKMFKPLSRQIAG